MPDEKDKAPANDEQSGAGYGNNTGTDDVGAPGEAEEDAEAHPS